MKKKKRKKTKFGESMEKNMKSFLPVGVTDQNMPGGYISHLAWERPGIPQEKLEDVDGQKDL